MNSDSSRSAIVVWKTMKCSAFNVRAFSSPWLQIGYAFIPIVAHQLWINEWNVEHNESIAILQKWIANVGPTTYIHTQKKEDEPRESQMEREHRKKLTKNVQSSL